MRFPRGSTVLYASLRDPRPTNFANRAYLAQVLALIIINLTRTASLEYYKKLITVLGNKDQMRRSGLVHMAIGQSADVMTERRD